MSVFTNPASTSAAQAREYVAAVLELAGDREPLGILAATPRELRRITADLPNEVTTRPEEPGKWSMRDILQHLADSELVFGNRIRMVIAHDRPTLTGYDQDLWAERLRYDLADAAVALDEFVALRDMNLRMLGRVGSEANRRIGLHSERGEESLAHMLRLYAGHDVLHVRQLERVKRRVTEA